MYIQHAKNIAEGKPYSVTGYIYNPLDPAGPQTYPPIFPFLLVPVYLISGLDFQTMKLIPIILFLLSLYAIYLNFMTKLSFYSVFAIIAIIGLNYYFWDFKDNILSDLPFLFFTYTFFYLAEITYDKKNNLKDTISLSLVTGIFLYLSYGTRSVGIALIPSLLLYDLFRERKLSFKVITILLVFLLLALMQLLLIHKEWSYFDQLYFNHRTILKNMADFRHNFYVFWDNGYSYGLSKLLFVFISLSSLLGFLLRLRRIGMYEIFLLLYSTIIIIWPGNQDMRFIIPIIPLYLFYFFYFYEEINSYYHNNMIIKRVIFLMLIITTSSIWLSYSLLYIKRGFPPIYQGIHKKDSVELFNYVRNKTNSDDVIIFTKPRVLSLMTSRKSTRYLTAKTDEDLMKYFEDIRASYIIVFNNESYLLSFLVRNNYKFCLIFSNNTFTMYKILPTI